MEYLEGESAIFASYGDPAMSLAVPVDQFRTQYLFHAPTNYVYNYVNIIAPNGAVLAASLP